MRWAIGKQCTSGMFIERTRSKSPISIRTIQNWEWPINNHSDPLALFQIAGAFTNYIFDFLMVMTLSQIMMDPSWTLHLALVWCPWLYFPFEFMQFPTNCWPHAYDNSECDWWGAARPLMEAIDIKTYFGDIWTTFKQLTLFLKII